MLNIENASLTNCIVHLVGNKHRDEDVRASKKEIDLDFYKSQVPEAVKAWEEANKKGQENLDLTGRYLTEQEYYQWHYTQHGKPSGIRGYAKEDTAITNNYLEKPTDAEKQQITDIAALTEEEKQKEGERRGERKRQRKRGGKSRGKDKEEER